MNATEHIVETYYRLVRKCFTATDIKVPKGNNRQFDLLAVEKNTNTCFHVEVSVTHQLNWSPTLDDLIPFVQFKFFGFPRKNTNKSKKTDAARGKNYFQQICETYRAYGIMPDEVRRVICVWHLEETAEQRTNWLRAQEQRHRVPRNSLSFLFFRDEVFTSLMKEIGRSHYSDDILRTLSLIRQFDEQRRE